MRDPLFFASDDPSVIADTIPSNQVQSVRGIQADQAIHNIQPVHGVHHQQRHRSTVLVSDVFQTLKSDLGISSHNCKATKAPQPRQDNDKHLPQGDRFNFSPSTNVRLCFLCLSPNHLVRECRGEIRCIYCFSYGHRARFCVKRKLDLQHKWAAKPNKLTSGTVCVEDGIDKSPPIQWSIGPMQRVPLCLPLSHKL